jgi:hypothetical protein
MLIQLHNTARIMEQSDNTAGNELRQIADRFSTLIKNAHSRRHWCNGNEK